MMNPIFIKANIQFTLDEFTMKFKNRNISTFGSYGFTWDPLEPEACTGTVVSCHLEISSPETPMLQTKASLLRERTRYGDTMGLRFYFEKIELQILEKLIKKHGFYPTEYLRKYPRIPSTQNIGVYPLRVIAKQDIEETLLDLSPMVLDIRNISINGILISTENPQAHPCGYEMAIEALGVEPTNCILFEDSTPGIASGVEAKLRVFAIEMANHTYQDQSQAEDRIKDFTGVTAETFENWIKNKK